MLQDVSLTVARGEIAGLFGLMGAGRSELARALFGLDPLASGEVRLAGAALPPGPRGRIRADMAFVTENRREEGLTMDAAIVENLALVAFDSFGRTPARLVDTAAIRDRTEAAKRDPGIKAGDIAVQPVNALSGGNQQKVVIGKWQMEAPKLFFLDEPTRGVDVGAKFEIYALADRLAAQGGGILFISSELDELMGMADRIVVMNRGEVMGEAQRADFDRTRILCMAFREGAA